MRKKINNWSNKIVLGTAQFGLDYGISNFKGQINPLEAKSILDFALRNGINTLDTAVAYGTSESVIGSIVSENNFNFDIISKFSSGVKPEEFDNELRESLKKLNCKKIKGYLAHSFSSFKQKSIHQCLIEAKDQGLIDLIGVSVYYPEEVIWLLENYIDFDLVQLPFNIFDQRFRFLFDALIESNVDIHARSIFLQGLFFMEIDNIPSHFNSIKEKLNDLHNLSIRKSIPLSALLLNFVMMQSSIDKVIIGVTGLEELKENINSYRYLEQSVCIKKQLESYAITDEKIILPFKWC
jgi:uncharacterized protein